MEESIELLRMLHSQNIDTVVATPHFYADSHSPEEFFARRECAYEALKDAAKAVPDELPHIALGAEVLFYDGISRLEGLERFCIKGTNLLLLEMPFYKWNDFMMREVKSLALRGDIKLILAHIERYLPFGCEGSIRSLAEMGVLMQSNASNFIEFSSRRRAIKMLDEGLITFLGSDCHSVRHRPPRLGEAHTRIGKRLGKPFLENMDAYGRSILDGVLSIL